MAIIKLPFVTRQSRRTEPRADPTRPGLAYAWLEQASGSESLRGAVRSTGVLAQVLKLSFSLCLFGLGHGLKESLEASGDVIVTPPTFSVSSFTPAMPRFTQR